MELSILKNHKRSERTVLIFKRKLQFIPYNLLPIFDHINQMFASFDAQDIVSFKYHVCVSGYDQNKLDYDTKIFRRLTDDDDKSIIHNYKEKIRVTFMIMERFARPIKHVYLLYFLC